MMPLLFVMIIIIAVRSVTLEGANEGIVYLFKPDFSKVTFNMMLSALGQASVSYTHLSRAVEVSLPDSSATRDILYVCGIMLQGEGALDTLHLFVNHWPSKLSDDSADSPRRMAASEALKEAIDSVRAFSVSYTHLDVYKRQV